MWSTSALAEVTTSPERSGFIERFVRIAYELIDIGELTRLGDPGWALAPPEQGEVLRQEVIFSSQRQERVDLVAIAVLSENRR